MPDKRDFRFCVAPMMDWTDRHCRYFHRLLSRRARLYTEMLTTGAVIHGDRDRMLGFEAFEHPVAVQLGGSEPRELAAAAKICEEFGYDEINLNVGCPSDRVQNGAFGACLMLRPGLVADCVRGMKDAVRLPITVKCRIGVDEQAPEHALFEMAESVTRAGADALVVHARKAWLKGLSPRENRDVPPLDYPLVYRLKRAYPDIPIVINGGLTTISEMRAQLEHVDGVMVGRAAYQKPELLLDVDTIFYEGAADVRDGFEALSLYLPYVERELSRGERLSAMARHLLGLFSGRPGARAFRRRLALDSVKPGAGPEVVLAAMEELRQPSADCAEKSYRADNASNPMTSATC
jgi:tRNA-dihydrouridine synthase A